MENSEHHVKVLRVKNPANISGVCPSIHATAAGGMNLLEEHIGNIL